MYKGFTLTFMRDVPSLAAYFYTYDFMKNMLNLEFNKEGNKMTSFFIMNLSGGMAGWVSWLVVYPLDVIKSDL